MGGKFKDCIIHLGEEESLRFLEQTRSYHIRDEEGRNYLHLCCTYFSHKWTSAGGAYKVSNDTLIEKLIQKGVAVNGRDNMLRTPLHCFCINFDNWLTSQWLSKMGEVENPYLPDRLLEAGADVNAKDIYGRTPIFYCRDAKIAEYLHSRGAELETKDIYGMTPVIACKSTEMLDFFAGHGCNLNAVDAWGRNALAECEERVRKKLADEFHLQELPENDMDVTLFPGTYAYENKQEKQRQEENYILYHKDDVLKIYFSTEKNNAGDYDEEDTLKWDAPVLAYCSFEKTTEMLLKELMPEQRKESATKALLTQVEELKAEEIGYAGNPPYFGN